MKKSCLFIFVLALVVMLAGTATAGPYTDAGYHYTDSAFTGWATGYVDYVPSPASDPEKDGQYTYSGGVATPFRTPENATGIANNSIVSLGDLSSDQIAAGVNPGEITLTFDSAITNGTGDDFAVFENGFWMSGHTSGAYFFAELGYVEVSTDGVNFARFESDSLTSGAVGGYGTIDPTDVDNLMGKHDRYYGTGFDLDDLLASALVLSGLVDLSEINYVKVIDVPGDGSFTDADGDAIYDAYETWGSGGVDLDAIGVINAVPVPGAIWLVLTGAVGRCDRYPTQKRKKIMKKRMKFMAVAHCRRGNN